MRLIRLLKKLNKDEKGFAVTPYVIGIVFVFGAILMLTVAVGTKMYKFSSAQGIIDATASSGVYMYYIEDSIRTGDYLLDETGLVNYCNTTLNSYFNGSRFEIIGVDVKYHDSSFDGYPYCEILTSLRYKSDGLADTIVEAMVNYSDYFNANGSSTLTVVGTDNDGYTEVAARTVARLNNLTY